MKNITQKLKLQIRYTSFVFQLGFTDGIRRSIILPKIHPMNVPNVFVIKSLISVARKVKI